MLPRNLRQEALSRVQVRAIAAQAGVICGRAEDDFGLDMFVRGIEVRDRQYRDTGPQLDVQLKSTTGAELRPAEVAYDLEVRAYNLLREPTLSPRILVLLVLPENEDLWLGQTAEELILRGCLYWRSLRGTPATTNDKTVRVTIPRTNVFSAQAIQAMMNQIKQGIPL
jgi:hypothetical protein